MSALGSLRVALGSLARNPVLFLAGLAYGLVVLPQSAAQLAGLPLVPTILQVLTFFVTPFLIAGTIGMATESIDGDTSMSTLRRVGRARYVPLLVAKFIEVALLIAFGVLVVVTLLVGAAVSIAVTEGVVLLAVAVVGLVLGLLAVLFFVQFYPVAVAMDDADAVEGYRRSVRLVRENLLSTLGYTIITILVAVVTTLPIAGATLFQTVATLEQFDSMQAGAGADAGAGVPGAAPGTPPTGFEAFQFSTQEVLLLSAVSLAVTMLLFTFKQTYATAFYRAHAPPVEDDPDRVETADDDDADSGAAVAADNF